jgi:hypothetical protein
VSSDRPIPLFLPSRMHVEALNLPNLIGVVISIVGRSVLAEADNPSFASGGQHSAAPGIGQAHDLSSGE